jgi:hypothetical protein
MAQVDGMLRRVLTLPRSASADGYDEQPPSFRAARAAAKIISLSVEGEDVW